MVPYKPKFIWYPGEHRMPGGEFPFPPAVADLCQFMPPPASFEGPFVMVDRLMEVFAKMQLPDNFYGEERRRTNTTQNELLGLLGGPSEFYN